MKDKYSSWWNDDWDDQSSTQNYYRERWTGFKEKLSFWKSDKGGNCVFPEVSWGDNDIIKEKPVTSLEENIQFQARQCIPGFVGGDLYRLFFHEDPQLTKPEDNSKEVWFDALSSLPVYGLSMQTNKSRFWSKLATEEMINAIMQQLHDNNQLNNNGKESRQEQMERISKMLNDALNGKGKDGGKTENNIRQALSKGIRQAQDKMAKTRVFMNELGLDPNDVDKNAGDGTLIKDLLTNHRDLMDKFFFNVDSAVEFLRSTQNFFNTAIGKQKLRQTNFLESDNFSDIINPELFEFPFEINNINVMTTKKTTMIDLYIDISGSMSNPISSKDQSSGRYKGLKIIDAVTIFAYKLYKKGIVRNVYSFDTQIRKVKPEHILFLRHGGGTCFETVVKHFQSEKNKGAKTLAFILTDGCDDTDLYHKDAFWMFVEGGPESMMQQTFPDTQMRIWSNGEIKTISAWAGT